MMCRLYCSMKTKRPIESIAKKSDDELLRGLLELLQSSRRIESELVAHIGEVDQRRLYARYASSMFRYATEVLHLSEHEAYLRIEVARASRKHPMLLEMLADGRLHLSGIAKLAPHLTEANRDTLLERATHKSKREIEELVAELAPQPDVPATIRKLPEPRSRAAPTRKVLGPDRVEVNSEPKATPSNPAPAKPAVMKPIAPARYRIAFTASAELRDKLERLRALMRSSVPDGDLATLIEEAVTEKLERLESKRYGKAKTPRKSLQETDTSASSRYIPSAVRRAVYARDLGQCAFLDENGRRCAETRRLEFHHRHPYGRGGNHRLDNIELRCRIHNLDQAYRDYGSEVMKRYRRSAGRVSEPSVLYYVRRRDALAGAIPASYATFPFNQPKAHSPPLVIGDQRQ
jgi:5-methylcytosine-specific restriction endonuclease McrA